MNFAEFSKLAKNQLKPVLSAQNSKFEPIFEYLPFGIMEKCLLRTFSNFKEVSNGIKFSIFGLSGLPDRFFKFPRVKLKFFRFEPTCSFKSLGHAFETLGIFQTYFYGEKVLTYNLKLYFECWFR